MENWWDLDFEGTVRDFDFTRKAVRNMNRVLDSEQFQNMDAQAIYQYLFREMELVSFKDYLKRYIYERAEIEEPFFSVPDEVYREIIMDSFQENCTPHSLTPTTRKWSAIVKSWLSQETVRRSSVFLLGFGLHMEAEDVSDFLTKVLKEEDFDFSSAEETVYWFCCKNHLAYPRAEVYLSAYEKMKGPEHEETSEADDRECRKDAMAENAEKFPPDAVNIDSEEQLLDWLAYLKKSGIHERKQSIANAEFESLYERTGKIIAKMYQEEDKTGNRKRKTAEEISPADVEKILCSGIPVTRNGNLEKMSASLLAKHFGRYRMSRQRLDGLLKRQLPVERYDLITLLFFIYAQEVEPDWPTERYLQYIEEINRILGRCSMAPIYPVNPYEIFILMCLLTDCPLAVYAEIWELSYQTE